MVQVQLVSYEIVVNEKFIFKNEVINGTWRLVNEKLYKFEDLIDPLVEYEEDIPEFENETKYIKSWIDRIVNLVPSIDGYCIKINGKRLNIKFSNLKYRYITSDGKEGKFVYSYDEDKIISIDGDYDDKLLVKLDEIVKNNKLLLFY